VPKALISATAKSPASDRYLGLEDDVITVGEITARVNGNALSNRN
jgi:hypothetical protein